MEEINGGGKWCRLGMGNVGVSDPHWNRYCRMGGVFGRVLGEVGVNFLYLLV